MRGSDLSRYLLESWKFSKVYAGFEKRPIVNIDEKNNVANVFFVPL